jgi:hypothetical protein
LDLPEPYRESVLAQRARLHLVRWTVPAPSWLQAVQLASAQV